MSEKKLPEITKKVVNGSPVIHAKTTYEGQEYSNEFDPKYIYTMFPPGVKDFDLVFDLLCKVKNPDKIIIFAPERGCLRTEYRVEYDGKKYGLSLCLPNKEVRMELENQSLKEQIAALKAENEKLWEQLKKMNVSDS